MRRFISGMFILSILGGCSGGITFDAPIYMSPAWWVQFGGSDRHISLNANYLSPPLQLRWQTSVGGSFGNAAPIASEKLVFTPSINGWIYLFGKDAGKDAGHISLQGSIIGTPAAKETLLFVPLSASNTSLIAINLNNAKVRWKKDAGPIESSILIVDDFVYTATVSGNVLCVGLEDSATIWSKTLPKQIHSSAVTDGKHIVIGCDDGYVYAFDKTTGEENWKYKTGEAVMAAPIVVDGIVYIGSLDKNFYALYSESGALLWKQSVESPVYAAATADEKNIFIGTTGGKLFCLDAKSGSTVWTFQTKSVIDAAPIVADNYFVVCGLDKFVRVLERTTGIQVWAFETEGKIRTSPIISNDLLVVITEAGDVYAFESKKK